MNKSIKTSMHQNTNTQKERSIDPVPHLVISHMYLQSSPAPLRLHAYGKSGLVESHRYLVSNVDVGPRLHKQSHTFLVTILSGPYQSSIPILRLRMQREREEEREKVIEKLRKRWRNERMICMPTTAIGKPPNANVRYR
jgi:hypothetical protein